MYQKFFPADLQYLHPMLTFIENFAIEQNFHSTTVKKIILSSEEAIVNIIRYSYPEEKKGIIEIICEKIQDRQGIKITLKDEGSPFNPIEATSVHKLSPDHLYDSEEALGGYGIYLIKQLMDIVEYQRINNDNVLSLTKYNP